MSSTTELRAHIGLGSVPFTREIPVRERWRNPQYDEILQALLDTVNQRMSGALLAAAGTGKTMLLRTLTDCLAEARFRVHYVKVTALSKRDFCRELCEAVQATPAATYGGLVRRLQERLCTLYDQDSLRPILLLDEAHDMRPDVLAMLRVITNFEMDSRLVVSIILTGQMPLLRLLRRQELEAVSRRLAHYSTLRLLTREETVEYIRHRLHVAGAEGDLFDQPAHDAIFENAGGNLRAINGLALKSLKEAARAKKKTVGAEHVVAARRSLIP